MTLSKLTSLCLGLGIIIIRSSLRMSELTHQRRLAIVPGGGRDSINGPQVEIVTDEEAETQRGGQKSYLDSGPPVPSLAF